MVRTLSVVALLFLAGSSWADDAAARKVKVALSLHQANPPNADKVKAALDAALPKSKERKVAEALRQIGVTLAPMPRAKAAPCDCCGPACKCAPCDCLSYSEAYSRAAKGERLLFTADAADPSRPADVKPGRYECWRDKDGTIRFDAIPRAEVPADPFMGGTRGTAARGAATSLRGSPAPSSWSAAPTRATTTPVRVATPFGSIGNCRT